MIDLDWLNEVLRPIREAILDLRRLMPSVRSATVTGVSPLRVQFDGETAPVSASPTTLVPVGPGDRVRVLHYGNTDLILGRVSAPSPVVGIRQGVANQEFPGGQVTRYDGFASSGDLLLSGGVQAVSNYGLRVPETGVYQINASIRFATSTMSRQIRISGGGTEIYVDYSTTQTATASLMYPLQADDIVSMSVWVGDTLSTALWGAFPHTTSLQVAKL